eukprot:TRINITY_DN4855_c0_g1_i1.p5 TRINITY_DN4855_c0_g1~~TRINITY_DN4855_c0_g1_i1.p5  ORF type:complete len:103 (+),score=5.03 TRINITY_DN4855_c0_g1_i1:186-494(+)
MSLGLPVGTAAAGGGGAEVPSAIVSGGISVETGGRLAGDRHTTPAMAAPRGSDCAYLRRPLAVVAADHEHRRPRNAMPPPTVHAAENLCVSPLRCREGVRGG